MSRHKRPPKYGPTEWNQGDWKVKLRIAALVVAVIAGILLVYALSLYFMEPGETGL